jgi:hypothetical protein
MRSHGFALSMLLEPVIQKLVSDRSNRKALAEVQKKEDKNEISLWDRYEHFSIKERYFIGFVRRYLKILKSKRPLKEICRDAPVSIRSTAALDLKIKGMVA